MQCLESKLDSLLASFSQKANFPEWAALVIQPCSDPGTWCSRAIKLPISDNKYSMTVDRHPEPVAFPIVSFKLKKYPINRKCGSYLLNSDLVLFDMISIHQDPVMKAIPGFPLLFFLSTLFFFVVQPSHCLNTAVPEPTLNRYGHRHVSRWLKLDRYSLELLSFWHQHLAIKSNAVMTGDCRNGIDRSRRSCGTAKGNHSNLSDKR
jgi:hypothetical protein